jgi:hypothetical protein
VGVLGSPIIDRLERRSGMVPPDRDMEACDAADKPGLGSRPEDRLGAAPSIASCFAANA